MDWQEHMGQNAVNWLSKGVPHLSLDADFLMLFGNPHLFQQEKFSAFFSNIKQAGVFYRAIYRGRRISYCYPIFGAPAVAMYTEVVARLGARNILACGYVGGVDDRLTIGSYVVAQSACGFDGCSRAYFPNRDCFHAVPSLTQRLLHQLDARGLQSVVGCLASIDALMLENDAMIADFAARELCAVDLETACLYAVAEKLNLKAASLHIVSDNPHRKDIDELQTHTGSFAEQVEVALDALIHSMPI